MAKRQNVRRSLVSTFHFAAHQDGEMILVSVAGAGPRGEVRASLKAVGRIEGRDFFCAA